MSRFDLNAWVSAQQGQHFCHCGCEQLIQIKRHHHARGIPRHINGHFSRVHNAMFGRTDELNPNYRGGRYIDANGYVFVLDPARGTRGKSGSRYVYEHRLVMERILGRRLQTNEQVHHRNGDKIDNRAENLEVLSASEHAALHVSRLREKHGYQTSMETQRRISRRESNKEVIQCHAS